jgi:hypothetical protein
MANLSRLKETKEFNETRISKIKRALGTIPRALK